MTKIKRFLYYFCISVTIIFFVGCSNPTGENEQLGQPTEQQPEIPAEGGELVLPVIQFDTFNPIINDNQSVYYLNKLIYESLIKLDGAFKAQPALAKSWSTSANGEEWSFELNESIKWHDGKPFTAEDVRFTIDTIKKYKDNSIFGFYVEPIKEVRIIGTNKITIYTNTPMAIEAFTFPVIPKHKFESNIDLLKSKDILPIGTGPYKVDKYDKFKGIELSINREYWSKLPYIAKIIAKRIPDPQAALTSVEANEITMAQAIDYDWEKYTNDKSIQISEYITQEYEFLGFNFNNPFLQDKNIRKAIAYGIDRHKIVREVYLGHATITDVPFHPASIFYDEEEQNLGEDLNKAKGFMQNSTWNDGEGGNSSAGQIAQLSLLVNADNEQRVKTAEVIAEQLERIGIKVIVDKKETVEFEKKLSEKSFDIVLTGWRLSVVPDIRFAIHSAYVGSSNFTGYSNLIMDQILDQAALEATEEIRKARYKQVQKLFVEELPYMSLYFKNMALVSRNTLKGDISPNYYDIYNNIENLYIAVKSQ